MKTAEQLYEELRAAVDNGHESMTHEDALACVRSMHEATATTHRAVQAVPAAAPSQPKAASEDSPIEWAVAMWKDRARTLKELRTSDGQALAQPDLNLNCKSTQKRLATLWGFVPAPQQEPVAWYVTGCGRLLDEDEAKAEARHIGGTAMAIPVYTAPSPRPQRRWMRWMRRVACSMPDGKPAPGSVTVTT